MEMGVFLLKIQLNIFLFWPIGSKAVDDWNLSPKNPIFISPIKGGKNMNSRSSFHWVLN